MTDPKTAHTTPAPESLPPATPDAIIVRATDASLAANTHRSYRTAW